MVSGQECKRKDSRLSAGTKTKGKAAAGMPTKRKAEINNRYFIGQKLTKIIKKSLCSQI